MSDEVIQIRIDLKGNTEEMFRKIKEKYNFETNTEATRSGKTVFADRLVNDASAAKKTKTFLVDTKYEFEDIKSFQIPDLNQGAFVRRLREVRRYDEIISDPTLVAEFAAALAWEFYPSILYLEEIEEFINVNEHLPISHPLVYKILQQGASQSRNIIVVSQMIQKVHKSFVNQASDIFVFPVRESECRKIEEVLAIKKNTINFRLPEDLYKFYHITSLGDPIFYEKIKQKKKRGRKKIVNTNNESDSTSQ